MGSLHPGADAMLKPVADASRSRGKVAFPETPSDAQAT